VSVFIRAWLVPAAVGALAAALAFWVSLSIMVGIGIPGWRSETQYLATFIAVMFFLQTAASVNRLIG
jgi:hypothetical protein